MADSSLVGCMAYIYGEDGTFLLEAETAAYDVRLNEIEVEGDPRLKKGAFCKVVVDTSPLPWDYNGRIASSGTNLVSIALYNGKRREFESRRNPRFKVNTPAVIECFVSDKRAYALHTPINVTVVDISRSGARISVTDNVIAVGVRFEMRLKIGTGYERVIAEAVNCRRTSPLNTEYGCSFHGKSGDIKERVT